MSNSHLVLFLPASDANESSSITDFIDYETLGSYSSNVVSVVLDNFQSVTQQEKFSLLLLVSKNVVKHISLILSVKFIYTMSRMSYTY